MKAAKLISVFMAIVMASAPVMSIAGDCQKTGSICIDKTPIKNISGLDVQIAEVGGCWEYEDTFVCAAPGDQDYCHAISNAPGCSLISSVCTERSADNACENYQKIYRCGSALTPPAGVVKLEDSHTITYDATDTAPCASYKDNPSCHFAGKQCLEGPETRIIDGVSVYKDCWSWKDEYTCLISNPVDYCMPLKQAGCTVQSNTCSEMATTGVCAVSEFNYTCAAPLDPPPPNVSVLDSSYTVVSDGANISACATLDGNPHCKVAKQTCVEGAETRNIGGLDVYKDCWAWQKDYVCSTASVSSFCDYLRDDPSCTETGTNCVHTKTDGSCSAQEHEFRCVTAEATTSTATDCGTQTFCIAGECFDTSSPPDKDFAKVIAYKELVREMTNLDLFKGEAQSCSDNPLSNCCKKQGGGHSSRNDVVMKQLGQDLIVMGGAYIKTYGSAYVYNALYEGGATALGEMASMAGLATAGGVSSSFSLMGFQFEVLSQAAAEALTIMANGEQVYQAGQTVFVGFDPTTLIIMVAIMVIMEMMKCERNDMELALKRGQDLCHKVGSYCSEKILGSCWEKTEGWCCFPSKLGRIIQEQGRAQLGKSWGEAEDPDCSGFAIEELEQLRFDEMDLSEFLEDIKPTAKTDEFLNKAIDRATGNIRNYYEESEKP